jgi:hypothetical protein
MQGKKTGGRVAGTLNKTLAFFGIFSQKVGKASDANQKTAQTCNTKKKKTSRADYQVGSVIDISDI